ncbi:MAG: TIGR00153 family protein [Thermoplasmata archaeon]|nr:MAG: TIGR00153 family protein [Thermoplasmata archaeon]
MEKESKHVRIPVANTLRRSPFEGLYLHAEKVKECIATLDEALRAYCEGNYDDFKALTKKVAELEGEADQIKGNIRNHLPRFIFMPVDKADFLMLLREEDQILDYAEDTAVWLDFRRTPIPESIKDDFMAHADKVVECVEILQKAMENVRDLLETSFSRKEREQTKKLIHEIHKKEYEADLLERELTKKIFALEKELDPISIFHLVKVVDIIAQIANHAENAGDRIRAMIAK